MKNISLIFYLLLTSFVIASCGGSNSSNQEPGSDWEQTKPVRARLSATELLQLSEYREFPGMQRFMKDRSTDFLHATPGYFASNVFFDIRDSTGKQVTLPASVYYAALFKDEIIKSSHIVHTYALADELVSEFKAKGFLLKNTNFARDQAFHTELYTNAEYPGITVYYSQTYYPWPQRSLNIYRNMAWPCYVFEVMRL